MAEPIRKYSKEESEAYRQKMLEDNVRPFVKKKFDKHPELKSAVMFLSQYWNDEASDAVHCEFAYSIHQTPNIDKFMDAQKRLSDAMERHWKETKTHSDDLESEFEFFSWMIEGPDGAKALGISPETYEEEWDWMREWDENGEVIPHFAAYVKEEGSQDASFAENNTPYAVLRKEGDQITIEIVGKMHRSWLDGVACEWELEEESHAAKAEKQANKTPGFFARLFGKK